jgi:taurine dioxygenase
MTLRFELLSEGMGKAVDGLDLGAGVDAATAAELRRALLEGLVLCARGQRLDPRSYVQAVGTFGPLQSQLGIASHHPEQPEIVVLSSEDRDVLGDGGRLVVGAAWHTDDSFMARPCSLTALYGVHTPSTGGDTQFTNMYAAYDALPETTKRRVVHLRAEHRYDCGRKTARVAKLTEAEAAKTPPVLHPLVRTHPETGRKALYLNPNRIERVAGLERAESDELLDELTAHAIEARFQYRHRWRPGDVLVWDNRCTMHRANGDYPPGERRLMWRLIVEGDAPT